MEIFIKVVQFILSFSLLVIIHELGHFLFARLFKTRVDSFYLFFNPWFSLFKIKRGDTEYGIGWIPFGGYVKIAGMIDESMDTEQMKKPVQPYEFRAKPAWQRLLIMVGGVVMNVILAICIYIGLSFSYGDSYLANKDVKYGYTFSPLAQEIGFQNGDKIVDIGGAEIEDAQKVLPAIVFDQATYVTVERNGEKIRIDIPDSKIAEMLNSPGFASVRFPFIVNEVEPGSGADKVLRSGDKLISFNGVPTRYFDEYQVALAANKSTVAQFGVERDSAGVVKILNVPIAISEAGTIGIRLQPLDQTFNISTKEYTFWQAIPKGITRAGEEIANYWKQIKLIFTPKTEAYKSLGGIMAIGSIFPTYWSWEVFWRITAFLSIVLAVMNILPIPALDGGHVFFLLFEVITRRKPSDKFMESAQMVGIVIIFALLILANGNDIYRFFIK